MNSELSILKRMKKSKVSWEAAKLEEEKTRTLAEFF